jgi:hypothetical protein
MNKIIATILIILHVYWKSPPTLISVLHVIVLISIHFYILCYVSFCFGTVPVVVNSPTSQSHPVSFGLPAFYRRICNFFSDLLVYSFQESTVRYFCDVFSYIY